jgi:ComF family protein
MLGQGFEALLDLLAPVRCAACDAPRARGGAFCFACADELVTIEEGAELFGVPAVFATRYGRPIASALERLKYRGSAELAPLLARLVVKRIVELGVERRHLLVPVPLHPRRLAERGYNQSALLAAELAHCSGARHAPRLLERRRFTEQQAGQDRAHRLDNVRGAFSVRDLRRARGGPIILVDDVVTTGATIGECLDALRSAGAEVALVVALARAGGST